MRDQIIEDLEKYHIISDMDYKIVTYELLKRIAVALEKIAGSNNNTDCWGYDLNDLRRGVRPGDK